MTSADCLRELRLVTDLDTVPALAAHVAHLREAYPGDREAEVIARVAERKRRRLLQEA